MMDRMEGQIKGMLRAITPLFPKTALRIPCGSMEGTARGSPQARKMHQACQSLS